MNAQGMTMGSLFDGAGTCPLAAAMCGITPVWASEIEPYPIKVTKARIPSMKHLGDIAKIHGGEVEPVDIITFGSPCQDLSIAGKQAGLRDGERSNLFFEAARIIREMRTATGGAFPRFIMWENVPGAFSSNKREDFRAALEEICSVGGNTIPIPRPPGRKWLAAGEVMGDGFSVAWRTLDAQYWGVPQRRRRIYLVADFAGECAGEILFERDGVFRDIEPCDETGKGAAADAVGGTYRGGGVRCLTPWDHESGRVYDADGQYPALEARERSGMNRQSIVYPAVARSLCARHDSSPCIDRGQTITCYPANQITSPTNRSNPQPRDACPTLAASSSENMLLVGAFMGGQGEKAGSIGYDENVAPTLKAVLSGGNTVPDIVYSIQGNIMDRQPKNGGNGAGFGEDIAGTLTETDRHAIAYDCSNHTRNDIGATLQAKSGGGHSHNYINPVCYAKSGYGDYKEGAVAALKAAGGDVGGGSENLLVRAHGQGNAETLSDCCPTLTRNHEAPILCKDAIPPRRYIVRRLTPLECCRLQGMPDWWTDGVQGSDSAQYKMYGNGMALPCVLYVMQGFATCIEKQVTSKLVARVEGKP